MESGVGIPDGRQYKGNLCATCHALFAVAFKGWLCIHVVFEWFDFRFFF